MILAKNEDKNHVNIKRAKIIEPSSRIDAFQFNNEKFLKLIQSEFSHIPPPTTPFTHEFKETQSHFPSNEGKFRSKFKANY